MERTVRIALNQVPTVPARLRTAANANVAAPETAIEIERLCHTLFLDNVGRAPPSSNPLFSLYADLLTQSSDLRFRDDGPGGVVDARREEDRRLGQAMCRLMLHDHFRIRYFAHVSAILNRSLSQGLAGYRLERIAPGDAPDYLCAESVTRVRLAEGKGHKPAVGFNTAKFQTWRDQFARVHLVDPAGAAISMKGFIVATRIANERHLSRRAQVSIEDPRSPGVERDEDDDPSVGLTVLAGHYSRVSEAIAQPVLAYLLRRAETVVGGDGFRVQVFRPLVPPFAKRRFVGVIVDEAFWAPSARYWWRTRGAGTFFGVEEGVFKTLCASARQGRVALVTVEPMVIGTDSTSPLAAFEDGTISGPEEFFDLAGPETY